MKTEGSTEDEQAEDIEPLFQNETDKSHDNKVWRKNTKVMLMLITNALFFSQNSYWCGVTFQTASYNMMWIYKTHR